MIVLKTELSEILPFRNLYLQEINSQIRYNACHERGWTDSYVMIQDEQKVGYGSVKGREQINDRDAVFEFYVIPSFRRLATLAFFALLQASEASYIECQSNDPLLTPLLYQFGQNITAPVVLFKDAITTALTADGVVFRKRTDRDTGFTQGKVPEGDYLLETDKQIVATGGFLLHYNLPFADVYMEVQEEYRKRGLGSFLVQELKKQCYLTGRVPAARCNTDNAASKATLLKAGFSVSGYMLSGTVK